MNSKHTGLHHIEIYVSNLEQTRQFYEWFLRLLGFQEFQSWDDGFSFIHGSTYLVFVQTAEKYLEQNYHRCGTGLNHLAFWASSTEQVDQVAKLLQVKGINLLYQDRFPYAGGADCYALYFEDPDRIKIELVAPD